MSADAGTLKERLYWQVSDSLVLTKRHLLHIPRIPELLVFATIQPVMFVLLFRYVFGGAIPVEVPGGYVNYLMAGIFIQTVMFGSVATGLGLAEDMSKGLVDRFRALPMSRSAVLVGRILADLVRNAGIVVIMLIVGLAVGFRPTASFVEWVAAAALLLLVSLAMSWVGAALALWIGSVEAVQSAGFIWLFPLVFASSVFVPLATMPGWLQAFANNQPVSLVADALRGLLIGSPIGSDGWLAAAWFVGVIALFVPLSVDAYKKATAK
jgi:ABC-2 type transport system permease protein/oleandomycin transport system permease protein